jgi:hypothetical protein
MDTCFVSRVSGLGFDSEFGTKIVVGLTRDPKPETRDRKAREVFYG